MFWTLFPVPLKLAKQRGKWNGAKQNDGKERREKDSLTVTWQKLPPIEKWLNYSLQCICVWVRAWVCVSAYVCLYLCVECVDLILLIIAQEIMMRYFGMCLILKKSPQGAWAIRRGPRAVSSENTDLCALTLTSVRRHLFLVSNNLGQGFPLFFFRGELRFEGNNLEWCLRGRRQVGSIPFFNLCPLFSDSLKFVPFVIFLFREWQFPGGFYSTSSLDLPLRGCFSSHCQLAA